MTELTRSEMIELVELQDALEKREKWEHWKENPRDFIEECLKIYPKDASLGLIPLKINSYFLTISDKHHIANLPNMAIVENQQLKN